LWPNNVEGHSVVKLIRNSLVRLLVLMLQPSILYNRHRICSELGRWISVLKWLIKSTPKHVAGVEAVTTVFLWRKE
jgi:hypothetical protein